MTDGCALPHDDDMTDADREAFMSDYLDQARQNIDEYGVHITYVIAEPEEGEAAFAYTAGLTAHGHPELIIDTLPPEPAMHILNNLARTVIRDGARYAHGDTVLNLAGGDYPIRLIAVEDTSEFSVANLIAHPNRDGMVEALHLVFPDKDYQWPWVEEANPNGQRYRGPVPADDEGTTYSLPSLGGDDEDAG